MDLKKFFNDPATLAVIASSGVIGFCVGIANGVVQKKHGGWGGFFAAVTTAIIVAIIVGLGLAEYIKSETLKLAIIGVCAIISDDIVAGFKALGSGVRTDPIGTFWRIVDAIRGRSAAPVSPAASVSPATPKE